MDKLESIYAVKIARLHGAPVYIVSDRDSQFTFKFWTRLQKALSTKLNFSIGFHPQTDGQLERTIQTLEEFSYNNNYQASIEMALYEALYSRKCRTSVAQNRQKSYTDKRRRELEFEVGDKVFIRIPPWKWVLRFRKCGKLSPRYIGPYEIVECIGPLAYRLALPTELSRIHNVFHVSMLRKYIDDPSHVSGVINQLVKFGKIIRLYLGIKYAHNQLLEKLTGTNRGLIFIAVDTGSCVQSSGLRSTKLGADDKLILSDIIKAMNG
ncbi:hypothetical protein WN943_014866 [Citrus x changshan-huyou]